MCLAPFGLLVFPAAVVRREVFVSIGLDRLLSDGALYERLEINASDITSPPDCEAREFAAGEQLEKLGPAAAQLWDRLLWSVGEWLFGHFLPSLA
jgi:hypothetical protein